MFILLNSAAVLLLWTTYHASSARVCLCHFWLRTKVTGGRSSHILTGWKWVRWDDFKMDLQDFSLEISALLRFQLWNLPPPFSRPPVESVFNQPLNFSGFYNQSASFMDKGWRAWGQEVTAPSCSDTPQRRPGKVMSVASSIMGVLSQHCSLLTGFGKFDWWMRSFTRWPCNFCLPFPNAFHGLYTKRIHY